MQRKLIFPESPDDSSSPIAINSFDSFVIHLKYNMIFARDKSDNCIYIVTSVGFISEELILINIVDEDDAASVMYSVFIKEYDVVSSPKPTFD